MATYSKEKLSGSTDGMGILISQNATAGNTIHTAHATALDEIWAWVVNTHTSVVTVTVEWGGATDPDNLIAKAVDIPAKSPPIPLIPGLILTNSKVCKIFAGTANKLTVVGYVNRITP